MKCTPKDATRKELGRSTDRFDALALSVWEPLWLYALELPESVRHVVDREPDIGYCGHAERTIDPYATMDIWRRR